MQRTTRAFLEVTLPAMALWIPKMTGAGICAVLLAAAVCLWVGSAADADTGPDDQSASMLHSAVQAYGHARSHGPAPDRCLAAQRVALLYLLRNEQLHYRIWRDIQKSDCPSAALSMR